MKSYLIALSTLVLAALPRSAEALEIQDDCCILRERFLLADVGLHVVNIGWAITLGNEQRGVFQASMGLYGAWTQTRNLFGVSGDAANIKATGGNLRIRYVSYLEQHQHGLWIAWFLQGGGAQIRDAKAARDDAHLGFIGAVGAAAGYAWWLSDSWHLGLGVGGQFHVATGAPGFARLYPHFDILVSYRL
jgi:hypothetical protein